MAFPLKDVRFTTRRKGSRSDPATKTEDALPVVYPRLLRDASIVPQIGIALGYFESMLGKERREFDPELLVQFFGDHKVARCIVTSLARCYRFRTPLLAEVVTPAALLRLERAALADPRHLRLALFDAVNAPEAPIALNKTTRINALVAGFGGFLPTDQREQVQVRFEHRLRLRRGQFERLLHLDDAEHAILTRTAPAPDPVDVIAFYNFDVLETLLRRAERIDLAVNGLPAEDTQALAALCNAQGVSHDAKVGTRATLIRLHGRQDSLGTWSRHGKRVAQVAVEITRRHRAAIVDAAALVSLRDKRAVLRLTSELLGMLAAPVSAQ